MESAKEAEQAAEAAVDASTASSSGGVAFSFPDEDADGTVRDRGDESPVETPAKPVKKSKRGKGVKKEKKEKKEYGFGDNEMLEKIKNGEEPGEL